MIFNQFPDLEWLRQQAERRFSNKLGWEGRNLPKTGWPTVILNVESASVHRDNIRGPLSVFCNLSGESIVETDKRRVRIKEELYYLTNHDQHYTLSIDKQKATTFNIHFGEYFTEQVFTSIKSSPQTLIDDAQFIQPNQRVNFHNTLHRKDPAFNHLIGEIQLAGDDSLLLDEKLYELMLLLLHDHQELKNSTTRIPSIKTATRDEIVRRLLFATDYIHTFYDTDISLEDLSRESCLSKFHFLRLFKIVFRKTPHQFIAEVRTERAKALLKNSSREVINVARSVGFKDASSFSRMFYNQVGLYPTQFGPFLPDQS
jgi:AraC family transcriptional regulator